jgi:hypothetical protein
MLKLLDHCIDHFFFLVPPLDMRILLQPGPKLRCFVEQVSCGPNLLLHIQQLHCFFPLPFLFDCWWSGWYELFLEILNLLLIFLDCLHNLINLFLYYKFIPYVVFGSFSKIPPTPHSISSLHSLSS